MRSNLIIGKYDEIGINFKEEDIENLFLISQDNILRLEMEHENNNDVYKLMNLWNIIKTYEQGIWSKE